VGARRSVSGAELGWPRWSGRGFDGDLIAEGREPYLGSDAIRQYWQRGAGTQREVAVRMGRPIITGDRVAVEWWTTMIDPDEGEKRQSRGAG
jgi:hypothetical protein